MSRFRHRINTHGRSRSLTAPGLIPSTLFGLVFAGFAIFVGAAFLRDHRADQAMLAWEAVPCTIVKSSIETVGEGRYSFSAEYTYERDGRSHAGRRYRRGSDQYTFDKVAEKAPLLKRYPVGIVTTCYVNPDNPSEAVLTRDDGSFPWPMLFFLFVVAGCAVFVAGARMGRTTGPAKANGCARDSSSPMRGTPISKANRGRVVGTVVFALVWNGIVSVFVYQAWFTVKAGRPEWMLIVFLVPFVVIGLGSLVGVAAEILRLFNPRIEFVSESGSFYLGKPLRLRYRTHGAVHRIARLRVSLHGVEKASYSQGKSQSTAEHEFHGAVLLETSDSREMMQGRLEAELPADAMHSFQSDHAAIEWRLKVEGTVAQWPDIQDELRLHVQPSERRFT